MATKVTILGEEPQKKELKKIEFVKALGAECNGFNTVYDYSYKPSEYKNIDLVCKGYNFGKGFDLMFAYNEDRSNGALYIGYFNDGVV